MNFKTHIFFLLAIVCVFSACKRDFYSSSSSDKLSFSADTICFDTLFTEKGSVTQCIKIKNNCEGTIKVNKICLEKGSSSEFYINANGVQGPSIENIDISSGDSIFVFIQAKLLNQNVDSLLYHEDKLLIDYNSIQDKIVISAWGQDVENYKGVALNTTTFTANKPYVIYDSLVVNKGETLTIEAGAKIYLHYNANIIVKGSIQINGTYDKPVLFSSDRLEETYQLLPGQWGSIIFEQTSNNNIISYAIIKNAVNGLVFQGDENHEISCDINNTQISNMSGYGIYAQNAHIESYNCVWVNCEYNIINIQGGWFNAVHNTIYNEGTPSGRKYYPSVHIADIYNDTTTLLLQQAHFYNTIVVGTMSNEIEMDAKNGDNSLPCIFHHCLLRDTYTKSDSTYYKDVVFYNREKNLFVDNTSFLLDTLSQAENIGDLNYANTHPFDLLNHSRIVDAKPDAGAIEYFYEKKD